MKVGVSQAGIRLNASCSPFDALPPGLYDAFKQAVISTARNWGLTVHFGQDDGTIEQAKVRFWQMTRVMEDARAKQAADGNE